MRRDGGYGYGKITGMTATRWDEHQADALLRILEQRGISTARPMAVEFVSGMVSLVADVAGVSADTARATITPAALGKWADGLAPSTPIPPDDGGHVLVAASTVSAGLAALLAVLGQRQLIVDPGLWDQAAGVALQVASSVLAQNEQDLLQIPSAEYTQLCAVLDDALAMLPADSGNSEPHGGLRTVLTAALHELELIVP